MTPEEYETLLIEMAGAIRNEHFRSELTALIRDYRGRCLAWLTAENQG